MSDNQGNGVKKDTMYLVLVKKPLKYQQLFPTTGEKEMLSSEMAKDTSQSLADKKEKFIEKAPFPEVQSQRACQRLRLDTILENTCHHQESSEH